jgi:carbonic anhydrase/acetyltransferase-like protein (isoleucine patch superfamily)
MDDRSELPSNVSLGDGCLFEHTRATFAHFRSRRNPGLRLGDGAQVFQGTTFAVEADGTVEIGEGSILAGAVFMCAEAITLGRGVVASYNVTIADCDFHPLDPDLRRRDAIAVAPEGDRSQRAELVTAPVIVDDGAWIGIGAIILKGVRIGRGARVGAGAVVARDIPPDATFVGNPARPVEPSHHI